MVQQSPRESSKYRVVVGTAGRLLSGLKDGLRQVGTRSKAEGKAEGKIKGGLHGVSKSFISVEKLWLDRLPSRSHASRNALKGR
jgi:hypothetical protein